MPFRANLYDRTDTAHGVGVGSFVYLRRIFEHLVDAAYQIAKSDNGWDDEAYRNGRMAERIQLLEGDLPEFLVENRSMYKILSQGVHELTENECLAAVPVVKMGIELVLDEKLAAAAKQKNWKRQRRRFMALSVKRGLRFALALVSSPSFLRQFTEL
ncbi:hypothetical protein [Pseudomonas syringae group genomosp. 3]|uniref:hypothetical protein n=1 Tax=Pseudomonas syringae group genomosp. 3 TaxID=251701 RepID=UPI000EFDF3C0|nr:hypothetical protein [Pseudomonas syringae group genomosp. 3]